MRSEQSQQLARRVICFHKNHGPAPAQTVKHFTERGISASTLYGIIERFRKGGGDKLDTRVGVAPNLNI